MKRYQSMSFSYRFGQDYEKVEFAYCIPYTYTMLWQLIDVIETHKFCKVDILCQSLGGVEVPILTITDDEDLEVPLDDRKYVVISGRVHPGESNGSWMVEGLLRYLLGTN